MDKKKSIMQVIKYFLIAASAGIIQTLSFSLLEELFHMPYWPSYLISLILSVLLNFTFNRKYTFHASGNITKAMLLTALYYLVFTPLSTWAGDRLFLTRMLAGEKSIELTLRYRGDELAGWSEP